MRYAPEPSTINWHNLGIPFRLLVWRRVQSYGAACLLLGANFFMILGLKFADKRLKAYFRRELRVGPRDADPRIHRGTSATMTHADPVRTPVPVASTP